MFPTSFTKVNLFSRWAPPFQSAGGKTLSFRNTWLLLTLDSLTSRFEAESDGGMEV